MQVSKSKINIAFGVTEDWLEYTFVTINSILENSGMENEYKFFIMSDVSKDKFEQITEPFKKKLPTKNLFDICHIKMNNSDFDGVVHDTRVGVSAYYRLKLSSLTDVDKIIYLDSDLVVLSDINELWNFDTNDYLIGAVEDKYSDLMTLQANLSEGDTYINSGVLLMNLKKFREENLEEKIFEKLREVDNKYSDQDVLNDLCRDKILYLPLKYNLMLTTDDPNAFPKRKDEYTNSLKSPFILHYAIKPWVLPVQYSEYWRKYFI